MYPQSVSRFKVRERENNNNKKHDLSGPLSKLFIQKKEAYGEHENAFNLCCGSCF